MNSSGTKHYRPGLHLMELSSLSHEVLQPKIGHSPNSCRRRPTLTSNTTVFVPCFQTVLNTRTYEMGLAGDVEKTYSAETCAVNGAHLQEEHMNDAHAGQELFERPSFSFILIEGICHRLWFCLQVCLRDYNPLILHRTMCRVIPQKHAVRI